MSKQINLSVNLEDNEIFTKELVNLLKAKTREVVRNNYLEIIGEEAQKEVARLSDPATVKALVKSACEDYTKRTIYNLVREEMDRMKNSDVDDIKSVISASIEIRVESMVNDLKRSFVNNAQDDFARFTRSYFAEKLSQIFDPIEFTTGKKK